MDKLYKQIADFMVSYGKELPSQIGKIKDIGVTKEFLTKEDLAIERKFKEMIKDFDQSHELFAEEEHDEFLDAENLWVADPISGTRTFIDGLPGFVMAIAHYKNNQPQFAAVYDPCNDDLYTAQKGKGAFMNGEQISVSDREDDPRIIYVYSYSWKDLEVGRKMFNELTRYQLLYRNRNSHCLSYCHLASGKYEGMVALTKDAFADMASRLILEEAGGIVVNKSGSKELKPEDRIFVAGNHVMQKELKGLVDEVCG